MKDAANIRCLLFNVMLALSFLLITDGCKKTSTSPATPVQGPADVWIQNMAFSPDSLIVAGYTTVTWTNKDGISHTATADFGSFSSPTLSPANANMAGGSYTHQFNTVGTFTYHCSIHPSETGMVIVH